MRPKPDGPPVGVEQLIALFASEVERSIAAAVESAIGALPAANPAPPMSKKRFARHMRVSEKTVGRWLADGMPHGRAGRTIRIYHDAARDWLLSHHG